MGARVLKLDADYGVDLRSMTAMRAFVVILFVAVGALAVRMYFQPEIGAKPVGYGVVVALLALGVAIKSGGKNGVLRP